jgi:hypothetical protein
MCPICWATALAVFSLSIGSSAALVAWRDRWTLALVAALVTLAGAHLQGLALVPWWLLVGVLAALTMRVAWLLLTTSTRLAIPTAWRFAKWRAAQSCPSRAKFAVEEVAATRPDDNY